MIVISLAIARTTWTTQRHCSHKCPSVILLSRGAILWRKLSRTTCFIVMNRYVNVQHIKCFLFVLGRHTLWTITKGTRQLYNCMWKPTGRAILWSSTWGHGVQTLTCQKLPVCLGTQNLIILLLLLLLCNYRAFCAVVWAMVSRCLVIGCWAVVFQATDLQHGRNETVYNSFRLTCMHRWPAPELHMSCISVQAY